MVHVIPWKAYVCLCLSNSRIYCENLVFKTIQAPEVASAAVSFKAVVLLWYFAPPLGPWGGVIRSNIIKCNNKVNFESMGNCDAPHRLGNLVVVFWNLYFVMQYLVTLLVFAIIPPSKIK